MTTVTSPSIVQLDSLTKSYNGIRALDKVSLTLRPGTIHGLVGHNGAGKSTLVKILSGGLHADSGRIVIGGEERRLSNPRDAHRQGIAVLFQELTLWPTMTVAENLWLETHPKADPHLINPRRIHQRAVEALRAIAPAIKPSTRVAQLSFADQQLVAIARVLQLQPRVLVLDEPTSGLGPAEVGRLSTIVRGLAAAKVSVLFISHRLAEVFDLCTQVTVLCDGRAVASVLTDSASPTDVMQTMAGATAGSSLSGPSRVEGGQPGPTVLIAEGLRSRGHCMIAHFELHEGEVVGVLGLPGSGRESVVYSLTGDHTYGRWSRLNLLTSTQRSGLQVGIVPGDRQREGLFSQLSVRDNVSIGLTHVGRGLRDLRAETRATRSLFTRLSVRSADIRDPIRTLSGGNQQKVVIARLLAARSRVMVMDQPTNGVDVRSRAEIYATIADLRSQGVAMVIGSTEADELIEICTRIIVVSGGEAVAEANPPFDVRHLMMAATGILGRPSTGDSRGHDSVR